jgi:hypothetical protein
VKPFVTTTAARRFGCALVLLLASGCRTEREPLVVHAAELLGGELAAGVWECQQQDRNSAGYRDFVWGVECGDGDGGFDSSELDRLFARAVVGGPKGDWGVVSRDQRIGYLRSRDAGVEWRFQKVACDASDRHLSCRRSLP